MQHCATQSVSKGNIVQLSLSQKVLLFTICRSGHSSSYSPSPVLLTGDRIKRLLDPLILPTVDQFPLLTCGTQPARQVDSLHIEQREKASGLRLRFTCHFSFALAMNLGLLIAFHVVIILFVGWMLKSFAVVIPSAPLQICLLDQI